MNATDLIAYVYQADIFHPACVVDVMVNERELSPAARDMSVEDALWQHAEANGFDPMNESTFDSSEHPKAVFAGDVVAHYRNGFDPGCGYCREPLL